MDSINLDRLRQFAKQHGLGKGPYQGFCIPLFCLRSDQSCGIGEYLDLIPLINLAHKAKVNILQLLPLNDTGTDSSPYSATSCLALNPIYIQLCDLPGAKVQSKLGKKLSKIEKKLKKLDCKDRIDYLKVRTLKLEYLELYYAKKHDSPKIKKGLSQFKKKHSWSSDYALFMALNEVYQAPWWKFPKSYRKLSPSQKSSLKKQHAKKIEFVQFLQWISFSQMEKVAAHAENKKVLLKGDIPILVGKNSVDVWLNQDLFILTKSVGAPPDHFTPEGQNWGFPPFNWNKKEAGALLFWKRRLKVAESLYHLYRLDHAVGFYRVWTCRPGGKSAKGSYLPKEKKEQLAQGQRILKKILSYSSMYPIAEDLGAVPEWVREDLLSLGIAITKVMKDQHHWRKKQFFYPPSDYPPLSMTTLGTHDMEVIGMWWAHHPKLAEHWAKYKKIKYTKDITRAQQKGLLMDSYRTCSLFHISLFDEFLALFPKFTPINIERRKLNTPGTWGPLNWSYRFVPTVEECLRSKELLRSIKSILKR